MAKKVRRVKKKNKRTASAVESTAEKPVENVASAKEKAAMSFRQEYAYVVKDLRQLLLVSGALFLLLIVINLLLQ